MSAYGYDSRRRRRDRRAKRRSAAARRFRLGFLVAALVVAAVTLAYDHVAHPGDLTPPVYGHPSEVTSTLSPHPATSHGHP